MPSRHFFSSFLTGMSKVSAQFRERVHMRKHKIGITYGLALLSVLFIAGCGQEAVTIPTVISTIPANGATSVAITTAISATFNEAMKPSSLSTTSFTVTSPGGAVAGSVAYSGTTATFTPTASLAYGTVYTATITTGATNPGGVSLAQNYVWSFTTITPAPVVISTIPANNAVNVNVNQLLSATFSEAMTAAILNP